MDASTLSISNTNNTIPRALGTCSSTIPAGNVIQLDEEATGFPAELEFVQRNEEVSWDYVKIGEASHLLPVGANFVVLYSSGSRSRVEVDLQKSPALRSLDQHHF